ncbi:MAG: hypothetical protein RL095_3463 [Verrucomicrobiota bacterium]|jgi:hypothetical protein
MQSSWSDEIADLPGMRLEHLRDALIAAGQWPVVAARLTRLAAAAPVSPQVQQAAIEKFRRQRHLESSRALQQWLLLRHLDESQLRDYFSRADDSVAGVSGEVVPAWLRLEYGFGEEGGAWRESLQKRRLAWMLSSDRDLPDWTSLDSAWNQFREESLKLVEPLSDWRLPPVQIAEMISQQRLRNAAEERGWDL